MRIQFASYLHLEFKESWVIYLMEIVYKGLVRVSLLSYKRDKLIQT